MPCDSFTRPFPYVEGATFDETTFAYIGRPLVWSTNGAWHYVHVSPNARGDLGASAFFSSSSSLPSPYFLVRDDFSPTSWQAFRLFAGTRGAAGWGDYIRTRAFEPSMLGWVTSVYTLGATGAEPLFYILGRQRDIPSIAYWWPK